MREHPQASVEQIARFLDQPLPEGIIAQAPERTLHEALIHEWTRRMAA